MNFNYQRHLAEKLLPLLKEGDPLLEKLREVSKEGETLLKVRNVGVKWGEEKDPKKLLKLIRSQIKTGLLSAEIHTGPLFELMGRGPEFEEGVTRLLKLNIFKSFAVFSFFMRSRGKYPEYYARLCNTWSKRVNLNNLTDPDTSGHQWWDDKFKGIASAGTEMLAALHLPARGHSHKFLEAAKEAMVMDIKDKKGEQGIKDLITKYPEELLRSPDKLFAECITANNIDLILWILLNYPHTQGSNSSLFPLPRENAPGEETLVKVWSVMLKGHTHVDADSHAVMLVNLGEAQYKELMKKFHSEAYFSKGTISTLATALKDVKTKDKQTITRINNAFKFILDVTTNTEDKPYYNNWREKHAPEAYAEFQGADGLVLKQMLNYFSSSSGEILNVLGRLILNGNLDALKVLNIKNSKAAIEKAILITLESKDDSVDENVITNAITLCRKAFPKQNINREILLGFLEYGNKHNGWSDKTVSISKIAKHAVELIKKTKLKPGDFLTVSNNIGIWKIFDSTEFRTEIAPKLKVSKAEATQALMELKGQPYKDHLIMLLELGADPQAICASETRQGSTPYLWTTYQDVENMTVMLEHGADPNAQYNGNTLLDYLYQTSNHDNERGRVALKGGVDALLEFCSKEKVSLQAGQPENTFGILYSLLVNLGYESKRIEENMKNITISGTIKTPEGNIPILHALAEEVASEDCWQFKQLVKACSEGVRILEGYKQQTVIDILPENLGKKLIDAFVGIFQNKIQLGESTEEENQAVLGLMLV